MGFWRQAALLLVGASVVAVGAVHGVHREARDSSLTWAFALKPDRVAPVIAPTSSVASMQRSAPKDEPREDSPKVEPRAARSHDGRWWVSIEPGRPMAENPFWTEGGGLWLHDESGGKRRLLDFTSVKPRNVEDATWIRRRLGEPDLITFSPDDRYVLFVSQHHGTDLSLFSVDIATGRVSLVSFTTWYRYLDDCRDPALRGGVVAMPHNSVLVGDVWVLDWHYVVSLTGERMGIIGRDDDNLQRFLHDRCGLGEDPGVAPKSLRPRVASKSGLIRCGATLYRHLPVPLLSGQMLDSYVPFNAEYGMKWDYLMIQFGDRDAFATKTQEQCPTTFVDG